jgi:hypothetical protein
LDMQRLTRDRTMRRSLTKTSGLNVNGTAHTTTPRDAETARTVEDATIHRHQRPRQCHPSHEL